MVLYITGGIGTGKSTCAHKLGELIGRRAVLFDADAAVHQLLTTPEIVHKVALLFGDEVVSPTGELDRSVLRSRVFADAELREALEDLLHPEVYRAMTAMLPAGTDSRDQPSTPSLVIAEIPLLYESSKPLTDRPSGAVVVVGCDPAIQRERVLSRGWSKADAEAAIEAQWPILAKVDRADYVVWSSFTESSMDRQLALLTSSLNL